MIGGNTDATIQVKRQTGINAIGERECEWLDVVNFRGWLDLSGGDSKYTAYNAKIQESTHIFLCDYRALDEDIAVTSENARMVIGGKVYDILLIDDPMGANEHLEIYLRFVGGQNGR